MLSAVSLVADQLVALDSLMWFATSRLTHCTACGAPLPLVAPLPACARYKHPAEPFEGIWQCAEEETRYTLALPFAVCHKHLCHVPGEPLWAQMGAKLRQRYGFSAEEG